MKIALSDFCQVYDYNVSYEEKLLYAVVQDRCVACQVVNSDSVVMRRLRAVIH